MSPPISSRDLWMCHLGRTLNCSPYVSNIELDGLAPIYELELHYTCSHFTTPAQVSTLQLEGLYALRRAVDASHQSHVTWLVRR